MLGPYPLVPGTPRWQRACTLMLLLGTLALTGCGGSSSSNPFAPATQNDLTNRAFTFATGANATLAAQFGLAANQGFTLQFGSFAGTTVAPVTLDVGTSVATGTVTLSPCKFLFDRTTFPSGSGPQSGQTITIDPCEVHRSDKTFRLTASASQTALSQAAQPVPSSNVALILTSDGVTGSYAVVDLNTRQVFKDLNPSGVQSDTLARLFKGRIYILNRTREESVQGLDPQLGFLTPPGGSLVLEQGSVPQDIVFLSETKAYVSLLGSPRLLILNPTTLTRLGTLDLRAPLQAAGVNGSPSPSALLLHDGLVYIALQEVLDIQSAPGTQLAAARGSVAVLDAATERLIRVLPLRGSRPVSELVLSPTLNRILVSTVGPSNSNDGGIEAINLETQTVDPAFLVSKATLGGVITSFLIVSRSKGVAAVQDSDEAFTLVTFDPSTGRRQARLTAPLRGETAHLALTSNQEIYFAVATSSSVTPGVRLFDAVTEQAILTNPLNTGLFPPRFTLIIE